MWGLILMKIRCTNALLNIGGIKQSINVLGLVGIVGPLEFNLNSLSLHCFLFFSVIPNVTKVTKAVSGATNELLNIV